MTLESEVSSDTASNEPVTIRRGSISASTGFPEATFNADTPIMKLNIEGKGNINGSFTAKKPFVINVDEQLERVNNQIKKWRNWLIKYKCINEDDPTPTIEEISKALHNYTTEKNLFNLLQFADSEYRKQLDWDALCDNDEENEAEEKYGKPPILNLVLKYIHQSRPGIPYTPKSRASLPSLNNITRRESIILPSGLPNEPEPKVLPDFGTSINSYSSWILWLYQEAGGLNFEKNKKRRGTPYEMHLFVSAFLHLKISDRTGTWTTLDFPHLREHEHLIPNIPSIERWFFPEGWDKSNKSRNWHWIRDALHNMARELSYVYIPGIGSIAMIVPSVIPKTRNEPYVQFTIRVPPSAANGARINWNKLCKYRQNNTAQYRAYLSACTFMDRTAHHGHPITQEIGEPLQSSNGEPLPKKGGGIRRSKTKFIPNPKTQLVRALDDYELTQLIGLKPEIRKHRFQTRKAFEQLHDDGVINLQKDNKKFRIFGPKIP